ncbi:MAG: septum formation initiator family protein [Spirochaetaceae bacterium]|jgi:cell division protein FtsB|nr:septum formation initiator family protein [Spirochaetaceae bacterium]
MPVLKYLASLWIAIMFYAVSSLFAGASGFSAYDQLNIQKEKQLANLRRLEAINEEIAGIKEALTYDGDTIYLYAREHGYGGINERFIRIAGLNGKQKSRLSAGEIFLPALPEYVSDKTLRIVSISIALSMILCFGVVDILRFAKN